MSPTATPIPERLAIAKDLPLLHGNHGAPDDPTKPPEACLLEMEGWIYGEEWGDCPPCVSPVLWRYGQRLNDRFSAEDRQLLKRFLGRMGGTGDDGQDHARKALAAAWVINTGLPNWLELAGMTAKADELRGMEISEWTPALRDLLYKVRDEVRAKHPNAYGTLRGEIRRQVRERLEAEGKPFAVADAAAVAVADAAAVAVADAAADAAAAADADADAAADAAAVAVAAAVAAADAAAVAAADAAAVAAADAAAVAAAVAAADAAADAVAAAAADAVAAADADADAAADAAAAADADADAAADAAAAAAAAAALPAKPTWSQVYDAVRNDDGVKKAISKAVPFVDEHRDAAIELFEQMLDPSKAEASA
jgi:hypothetical protein